MRSMNGTLFLFPIFYFLFPISISGWGGEDVLDRFALSASPDSAGVAEPYSPPHVGERFSSPYSSL